jgi:2-polyprenyl-3-methyl-5-hydroxy-6-metoxy-1,4-benzoquinol methylase
MTEKKTSTNLTYSGERLVQNKRILEPQRVENIARFNYFKNIISRGRILDYGCGAGEGTHFLSTFDDYEVIGVDISFEAVKYATDYYDQERLTFICGNILFPCFTDQAFDGIISVEVIEHVHDPHRYLENIQRLLKPEGVFMLTTPNQLISSPTPGSLWPDHVREYSVDALREILNQYFSEIKILGEHIPVYEENRVRQLVRKVSPIVKPLLPKWLRVRALPFLFTLIRSDIKIEDVVFTSTDVEKSPTLVAICSNPKTMENPALK